MYYVYRHIRLDKNTPFYVGKGKEKRAWSKDRNNKYWHNIANKFKFKVEIVKYFKNEKKAFNFEKKLITIYKKFNLCEANFSNGGEGTSGRKLSTKSKKAIGNKNRGKNNGMYGKYKNLNPSYGSGYRVKCLNNGKTFISGLEAEKHLNVKNVTKVCLGLRDQTDGLFFEFIDTKKRLKANKKRVKRFKNSKKPKNQSLLILKNIYKLKV